MGLLTWVRGLFKRKIFISIEVPSIITPEQIYSDYNQHFNRKKKIPYLSFGVKAKLEPRCIETLSWISATVQMDRVTQFEFNSFDLFIRNEQLPQFMELVMKVPFLVMLADLDKTKQFESWYQKFINRITVERNEALALQAQKLTDDQRANVAAVLNRLELFEAELEKAAEYLRQYCRDSIVYIESMRGVIEEMIVRKRVALLQRNTHQLAQEATKVVREKYDKLQQHALAVNTSLKVFGMSEDVHLGELSPAVLEKLERGSAQLKSNLDEIHNVYFGNAIVEEESREIVTT